MKVEWLVDQILRAASLVAPAERRAEWVEEWRSELFYIPRSRAVRFSLGAFRDAFWVWRNSPPNDGWLASPLRCLALLAAAAVVSIVVALRLPPPDLPASAHLKLRDVPDCCLWMLMLSSLLLPATRLAMGTASSSGIASWRSRVRLGIFLALKIALIQPTMLCGFLILIRIEPVAPLAPLAVCAQWMLTFRWVLLDQQRRCPVCLRLLSKPVRVGRASETFLEWYGAGSMCSRGHGLLQVSEITTSSWARRQWLSLEGARQ